MITKTRIGVLGCAKIAQRSLIPAIRYLKDDFELIAVASRTAEKANEFAKEFSCEPVIGYEHLLNRDDIDAIYIPLPTGMHFEWVGKAINAGKHVYVEKTFASTLAQTEALISDAAGKNIALMEGYMFLYHRQQNIALSMLRNGKLGELRHFYGCFGFPPLPPDDFRYDEDLGGGVLMDAAGYPLRAAKFFCGEDLTIKAAALYRDPVKGNSLWGSAYLANQSGLGASISFGFDNAYQCRYEIWGSLGRLIAERAYTPGPTFSPRLFFESTAGSHIIEVEPDNHFMGALLEFRNLIIKPEYRAKHYQQILSQSIALEELCRASSLTQSSRLNSRV